MVFGSGILHDPPEFLGYLGELIQSRLNHPFAESFFRGIQGSLFIYLEVWLSFAGRNLTDKFVALSVAISAVSILNLDHIVASLFYFSQAVTYQ